MRDPIKRILFDKQAVKDNNRALLNSELVTKKAEDIELEIKMSIALEEYFKLKYLLETTSVQRGKRTQRKLRVKADETFSKYLKIKSRLEVLRGIYE